MDYEISIIVPLFNEESVFKQLTERLDNIINNNKLKIEIILINDGSSDNTENLMYEKSISDERYTSINLSRNFGHHNALLAGLKEARANKAIMIIDGDLQDPPELIEPFFNLIENGYDIVNAVRKKRKENILKKFFYWTYYRILNSISDTKFTLDSGDFCMINRIALDKLINLPEKDKYLRGLRSWIGFKHIEFEYERNEREAGKSKYNFKKLLKLAYNGIFSFSKLPIKIVSFMGLATISFSFIYLIFLIYYKIYTPNSIPKGFTSIIFFITLFCGVQLISIGILGEYVLKIYEQVKNRPEYIIKNIITNGKEEYDRKI
jgi:glycosyltransferase involved in cell wall biosynthesis